ncbi:hypothetical protein HYC85_017979 [Camellia sinensis]|uniref:Heparan-alpha-glucosaminide N-acetyltransferase catalytic domain-containing protein n=1 Tax=Camellia sinensis TaxID=4442 RepID=A0A7J7GT04_CAMSI|nr:hypothetical protein HYC85_017979 [Camellia sinensis]
MRVHDIHVLKLSFMSCQGIVMVIGETRIYIASKQSNELKSSIEIVPTHDSHHYKNEEARIDDVDHGMDNEKEKRIITQDDQTVEKEKKDSQPPPVMIIKPKSKRVAILDAFRDLTIVVMILVDDAGEAYPHIDHSPWNGCTLANVLLPFLLIIVGVVIAFALKKILVVKDVVKKIIIRTLKLLFWGIVLQGYSHALDDLSYGIDKKQIPCCFPVILFTRRILVYSVVALIETFTNKLRPTILDPSHFFIFTAYKWQWSHYRVPHLHDQNICALRARLEIRGASISRNREIDSMQQINYKDYTKVKCGMRGHLGLACNVIGYMDQKFSGINHLYMQPIWIHLKFSQYWPLHADAPNWCRTPFEPEGLLSLVSTIMSSIIGIHYGHILIHFKISYNLLQGHSKWLKQWVSMGLGLLIVGIILHFTDGEPHETHPEMVYTTTMLRCSKNITNLNHHLHEARSTVHLQLCLFHNRCSKNCILYIVHAGTEDSIIIPGMNKNELQC